MIIVQLIVQMVKINHSKVVLLYKIGVSVNWRIVVNEGSSFLLLAGEPVATLTS